MNTWPAPNPVSRVPGEYERRRRVVAILGVTFVAVALLFLTVVTVAQAWGATPNCGGQNAAPQPVPYTCNLPGIDITAQGATRHFAAQVHADGNAVTITYLMTGGVLPVDVPIRIVHHEGISGAGGASDEATGVIPAGKTTATLTDSSPCRAGQLDVKAVDISNGSGDRFRVGGPWIQNGTGCNETTTVPQSSTTVPVPPSSTAPPPASTPGSTPGSSVESTAPTSVGGGALPKTGHDNTPLVLLGVLLVGLGAIVLEVRRRSA